MRQEADLVPYAPTRLAGSPLLVLAPHPDDEIFGAAPVLLEAARTNAEIHTVIVTEGGAQGDPEVRRGESREAARRLGVPDPEFWDFADRGLTPDLPDLLDRLRRTIDSLRPEMLVVPSPAELHPDHRALALAVYLVLREGGRLAALPPTFRLAAYEISAFMMPNTLVDLTDDWPVVRHASEAFSSQNDLQPYLEVLEATAVARRLTLGPSVTHAAAFRVVDSHQIKAHDAIGWAAAQGPSAGLEIDLGATATDHERPAGGGLRRWLGGPKRSDQR